MIIVDNILNESELAYNPIKVDVVAAGEMNKGFINQITEHTLGMKVVTTYNRSIERPIRAYNVSGINTYKHIEIYDIPRKENILPMGLAERCKLLNDVPKDQALTFNDVELCLSRFCDELWNEQVNLFN